MTIERNRPLPIGRYWIDVFESRRVAWEAWRDFAIPNYATIEHTESFPADGANESRAFVIFRVLSPVVWPDSELKIGVNVAPNYIRSSSDTAKTPPPEPSLIDRIDRLRAGLITTLAVATGVAVISVVFVAVRKGH